MVYLFSIVLREIVLYRCINFWGYFGGLEIGDFFFFYLKRKGWIIRKEYQMK